MVTRAEAAEILGVDPRRVSKMRGTGRLTPATTPHRRSGLYWREQVEALADERAERQARRQKTLPELPPDQDATFEELMAAAEWKQGDAGPFVDSYGAAEILGVTRETVGRMAAEGRLP